MSFDRLASIYRTLETIVFHDQLQEARVAFIGEIESPSRALVVGEGNGRFLAEFVRSHPRATVDCIELSGAMIQLAQARTDFPQINFVQADVNEVVLERAVYDLIVTHFVLDCFDEETLPPLIEKLAAAAAPSARWLVADFFAPARGWRRWWGRFLIATMYLFFRVVAGIEARGLVDYRPSLRRQGFESAEAMVSPNEMIRSELWQRCA